MKKAVEIKGLIKKYDTKFQLGKLDIAIQSGCIVGLIGENGAGKTTLIKALLNIIKTDAGTIKIFDKNYQTEEASIKEEIGVVLDNMFFPELLSPRDINCVMKDLYKSWDEALFNKYITAFSLPFTQPLKAMSKGMRKKVEIATALAHHPKLLILDEPTSGIDPVIRSEVLDLFLDFVKDEDHTILFSTHITSDLEHIADKIIFIDKGKLVLDDSRDVLLDSYGILKCAIDQFSSLDSADIIRYKKEKYCYQVLVNNKERIRKKYKNLVVDKITLEELMILMIKGEK